MQNLTQFRATSNFDGEYLRNGWRYSKSDKYFIYRNSFRVRCKKFCKQLRGSRSQIIPTEIDFFGRPYFGF